MDNTSKEMFELGKLLDKHKSRIAILCNEEVIAIDSIINSIYEDNIIIKAEKVKNVIGRRSISF